MKKIILFVTAVLLVLLAGFSSADGNLDSVNVNTFHDAVSGITLDLPDGWKDEPIGENSPNIRMQISPENDSSVTAIQFLSIDMYEMAEGKISRDFLNESVMTEELITRSFNNIKLENIQETRINNYRFFTYDYTLDAASLGTNLSAKARGAVTVQNGYLVMLQYFSTSSFDKYLPQYESLVKSVRFE